MQRSIMCVQVALRLFIVVAGSRVFAQSADPPDLAADNFTGDWLGVRTLLQDAVNLRAHFTTESAANPSGGNYQTVRYTQQIDFGADFDLHRLLKNSGRDDPGHPNRQRRTQSVGRCNRKPVCGAGTLRCWAKLPTGGNELSAGFVLTQSDHELGWSPVGDHFAGFPAFCDFQNGVICGHASAMTTDSGAHNFPTGEWGARINMRPRPNFDVATGIYQVNPNEDNANDGFDLSFRSTGVFLPIELGWLRGRGSGELPGDYKVDRLLQLVGYPGPAQGHQRTICRAHGEPYEQHNGRWGGYIMADQMVFREEPGSNRGLTLGAMVTMGDPGTAKYRYSLMAGGHYQGTFRGRGKDVVSLHDCLCAHQLPVDPISAGHRCCRARLQWIQTFESIAEIDYGLQVKPWLRIRPNLQYVTNPGGTGKIPNAFVIGLYTQVTF